MPCVASRGFSIFLACQTRHFNDSPTPPVRPPSPASSDAPERIAGASLQEGRKGLNRGRPAGLDRLLDPPLGPVRLRPESVLEERTSSGLQGVPIVLP